jgi:cbb3-type cytochrome oxidase subunit 3
MNLIYEHAPVAGLLFFFGIFVWVAFSTYRPSAKKEMQSHAFIPLKED